MDQEKSLGQVSKNETHVTDHCCFKEYKIWPVLRSETKKLFFVVLVFAKFSFANLPLFHKKWIPQSVAGFDNFKKNPQKIAGLPSDPKEWIAKRMDAPNWDS